MRNVFVITKEGRDISREGCEYIYELIAESTGYNGRLNDLVFTMGEHFNNPEVLADRLEADPDAFLVLCVSDKSKGTTFALIEGENLKNTPDMLRENKEHTSWDIIRFAVKYAE